MKKVETKVCSHCKEEKPVTEFYRNYLYKDFYSCTCKKCMNEMKKARYQRRKEEFLNGKEVH